MAYKMGGRRASALYCTDTMSVATGPNLLLFLAVTAFNATQVKAVGICDWDRRTYTSERGPFRFTSVRSGKYRNGYIGDTPFYSTWHSKECCYIGNVKYRCAYDYDQDYTATNIALKNLGDADAIFINSYYPVTLHRIENYVKDKSREDRFIVGKNMRLTKCPQYKATMLAWQFPGNLTSRSTFECFRDGRKMCKGVSTTKVKNKCRVVVAGKNLIHIRRVKASQGDVEFFYCYLDPAIPHIVLTYNVDWRASADLPLGGVASQIEAELIAELQP